MVLNHKEDNKELIVVIKPAGLFELDFQVTKEQFHEDEVILQEEFYKRFTKGHYEALLFLGLSGNKIALPGAISYLRTLATFFVGKLSKIPDIEFLRQKARAYIDDEEIKELVEKAPYLIGEENLDENWIIKLWERLNVTFKTMINSYDGSVEQFFTSFNTQIHLVGKVFFHLVESKKEAYPFAFLATYSTINAKDGISKHLPLKNVLIEYRQDNKKLLQLLGTVNKASEKSTFISELVESGEIFHPIALSSDEAYTFLKEIPIYEEAGILCGIPNWWKSKSNSLKMSVTVGSKEPSKLTFDSLVDFNTELYLGGDKIDVSEIKKLLSEAEGLSFIKGKWIEVNHEKLKETLKAYERAQKLIDNDEMNIVEAMRFELNAEKLLKVSKESLELEVTNGQWISSVVKKLTHPDTIDSISCGHDFHAKLRVYQERGLNWLYFMKKLGLGACLADDMGLGKTIQVIALLNYGRTIKHERALLIVPASLIGNWMDEIKKFAPSLKYYVMHPSENKNTYDDESILKEDYELYITTYGMVIKYEWMKNVTWDSIILDEAQAIKNPGTRQTKTIKKLKAKYKIAMTGTPIENRLSDLWSIFDFLNKGLLGSPKEFTDFTKRLKETAAGYGRLKQIVNPFVLRRLKTDKRIISDLPEKIEMKTYANLTKKQAVLYNKLVNDLKIKLQEGEEGINRKGLVLSSIMKFKQICNHPDEYLGENNYIEKESGKFLRLREVCENIYEKRERVIVFTQFKEIVEPLSDFLETIFQHKGLVIHGEIPVKKRKDIVAKFQGEEYVPFMVLSIKAGGVGLNLTAANHVIHFDRWWNPAAENQATDRAFRIGQKKNVIVHKFIMKGTIEEKIDLMLEDKSKLSKEIIPDMKENWITEMDNKQLMDLFALSV